MHIGPMIRAMNHNRSRVVLIVLEIAMTLAIVTNCVNVILAERAKMSMSSGFDDDNIIWMRSRPFVPAFREDMVVGTTIDADLRAIAAIPGVKAVANTNFRVWEGGGSSTSVRPTGTNLEPQSTQRYFATKDLVETLGSRISEGRGFLESDYGPVDSTAPPANIAVISKALADAMFPGQTAVGKSLHRAGPSGETVGEPFTVVGVIEHFYNPFGMPGAAPEPIEMRAIFVPSRVGGYNSGMRYLIRTEPNAMSSVIPEIEKRLAAANPGRVFEFLTTPEKKARWFSGSNILVATMSCIIIALVAVTALGLLGLTSLAVAERTKQIGTRRALGATRGDILRYFLLENWLVTTVGLLMGIGGAYALNFLLVSHVSDVKLQWQLVAGGMVLLWINGLISTLPAAMRATLVSPSIATRSV